MTPDPLTPFANTSGPRSAKLAIVGEAFGEQEDLTGLPFVGQSGQELTRMLDQAGIARSECFLTNVFPIRPEGNKIESFCGKKAEVGGSAYHWPPLSQGKYVFPKYLPHVQRLSVELGTVRPNLVVALGNTACWALLRATGIGSIRGACAESVPLRGEQEGTFKVKVLPTYHPSAVLRNWSARPIVVADFMKASREAQFSELRRPERTVLTNPTLAEVLTWRDAMLANPPPALGTDIETGARMIKCIGFAWSRSESIVIPFWAPGKPENGYNYWATLEEELIVREAISDVTGHQDIAKLFQNSLYDIQYMLKEGFRLRNCLHDTMLFHHSVFPELQKGLGFLGSIYTNEAAWKLMRAGNAEDSTKRDE